MHMREMNMNLCILLMLWQREDTSLIFENIRERDGVCVCVRGRGGGARLKGSDQILSFKSSPHTNEKEGKHFP